MSMGHDAYMEALCNEAAESAMLESGIWASKNGFIHIKDMTESHIKACMRILYMNDTVLGSRWYSKFKRELEIRNKS